MIPILKHSLIMLMLSNSLPLILMWPVLYVICCCVMLFTLVVAVCLYAQEWPSGAQARCLMPVTGAPRSLLFRALAQESTPPLSNVLSAGRRPTEVCGNDTARAAEIFLHFSPSRSQTGWHWLESGAARQGQSMRIDRAVRLRLRAGK